MNELDLPCTDCGTALIERSVHARSLSVSTDWDGEVRLAVCPDCGARYYPRRALSRLAGTAAGVHAREDR